MPSTYTTNNGIELIGTGEQSSTWGDTTNTNLSLIDAALDGQVTVTLASAGTSGSPNALPISDGLASNGRNRLVIFTDGADLGADAYVQLTPDDAEKIIYVRNSLSGSRNLILFQGTYNAANDFVLAAGKDAIVKFDGGGTGAVVSAVLEDLALDAATITTISNTTLNTGTVNATTVDTTSVEVTNLKAKDGVSAGSIANSTGVVTLGSSVLTTTDINGGTIDGVTIGGSSAGGITGTTITGSTLVSTGNITVSGTVDGRDVAADGTKLDGIEAGADVTDTANVTAAGALMDSELTDIAAVKALDQGVATTDSPTFAGLTATTADINGGTIDGVTIGGASAGAGTFTTLNASSGTISGDLTVDTNTLYVDSTNNRVGIGTASPVTTLDVDGNARLSNIIYTDGEDLTISADNNNSAAGSTVNILVDGTEVADFTSGGTLRFNRTGYVNAGICTQVTDNVLALAGGANAINNGLNIALSGPDHTASSRGFLMRDGTATVYNYQRAIDAHLWYTGGSERMRINSSGNVGIGTTNPSENLTVSAGSSNGIFVEDNNTSGSSPFVKVRGKRGDGNASQTFAGKLLLDGHRTDAAVNANKKIGTVAFGGNHTDGSDTNILYPASISGVAEGTFSNATTMPTGLAFHTGSTGRSETTGNVTFGDEVMRITSDGDVGIGTSSPATTLDVVGDVRVSNIIYTDGENLTISADANNSAAASAVNILVDGSEVADFTNGGTLRFNRASFASGGVCTQSLDSALSLAGGNTATNSGLNIALSGPDHTAGTRGFLMRDGTTTVYQYARIFDAHLWYTGGSERMRITSGGNVGIGTTNPGSKLSIVGLPTSSAGLSAGDIWNDSGTLKIV